MSRVGVDIDDVLMPWADTAHALCEAAGITNGATITRWEFWKDYGCEERLVWDVLDDATVNGGLYDVRPYPGTFEALRRLTNAGHTIHLVTARGFQGPHAALIRRHTVEWLEDHVIPHDTLTFSRDKTAVLTDYFIDDSLKNYDALESAGVAVYLLNRSHNRVACPFDPHCGLSHDGRARVDTLAEFVDRVVAA